MCSRAQFKDVGGPVVWLRSLPWVRIDGESPHWTVHLLSTIECALLAAAGELLLSGPKAMTQFVAELYAADPAAREEIKAAGGAKSWLSLHAEFAVYQPQPEEQPLVWHVSLRSRPEAPSRGASTSAASSSGHGANAGRVGSTGGATARTAGLQPPPPDVDDESLKERLADRLHTLGGQSLAFAGVGDALYGTKAPMEAREGRARAAAKAVINESGGLHAWLSRFSEFDVSDETVTLNESYFTGLPASIAEPISTPRAAAASSSTASRLLASDTDSAHGEAELRSTKTIVLHKKDAASRTGIVRAGALTEDCAQLPACPPCSRRTIESASLHCARACSCRC